MNIKDFEKFKEKYGIKKPGYYNVRNNEGVIIGLLKIGNAKKKFRETHDLIFWSYKKDLKNLV